MQSEPWGMARSVTQGSAEAGRQSSHRAASSQATGGLDLLRWRHRLGAKETMWISSQDKAAATARVKTEETTEAERWRGVERSPWELGGRTGWQ